MSSSKLGNFKKILAFLMAMALVLAYSPVVGAESVEVYHETFANGAGVAVQSGGASLTQVSGKTFDGNSDGKALYVSKRTNNWDAADFNFANVGMKDGKTYNITVKGYIDSNTTIPSGAQAALQTADGYAWISGVNMVAGKAFTLTGKYTVGSNKSDTRLRVQSNDAGKTVPFYIGDIVITTDKSAAASMGAAAGTGTAAATSTAKEVYHETFASSVGVAKQSGGASLTQVSGKTFDGNSDGKALYVSKRTNNWDAADFNFADVGMKDGKTYDITVKGYIDSNAAIPSGAQAALQTADGYAWISGVNMEAGKAFTLAGKYTVGSNKSDTRLRIQSNDAGKTVPFYVGDISITEEASSAGTSSGSTASKAEKFTTITFEDQKADGFVARAGTEKLTVTKEANHTNGGAYALKVEGRTLAWHGPSLNVEKYVDQGSEYKMTVWVKLIDPASSQLQLSTQVGNGSDASYNNLKQNTVSTNDGWVEFTGTYRYNNTSSNYVTIYVESASNATASFYIDDISLESTGSAPISIQKNLTAIKDAYKNSFLIGNAISAEDLEGVRLELLKKHFNIVTAGNAMKPDALQNIKGKFTFDAADKMIKQAMSAGLKVHGHVLVWHQQSPVWLNTKTDAKGNSVPLSRAEALTNMKTHIKTVMEHFGNKVISWDVVNEAMNDNPSNPADYRASLRKTPWYDAIGPDYVEQAFLAARAVLDKHPSWKIRLYYNDYNEDNQNKAAAIYNMVKDINTRYARTHHGKLLIDGIGMQGHYAVNTNPTNVELSLKKFISLGVKVSISELDMQAGSNYELSDKLAGAQGYLYAQLFKIFKANSKNIERVTFWGMDDGTSWRSDTNPTPFDKNLQAKPAYYGVINPDKFMAENKPAAPEGAKQSTAKFGTPVIDGKIDAAWQNAPALPINRYQMAWQGASGTARVLWDNNYLYVLVQVNDAQLDKKSANPWEQDSVEAFLDENNGKTSFYQGDDGQYRVNYSNTTSFNPESISKNFKSATSVSGTNYTVEMKIPFKTIKPKANMKIGFDAQINDGKDGARQSVATWNDATGNAYQDTSVFGIVTLTK